MGFELFAPVFARIDEITAAFVTDISSRAITTMTPFITACLTLSFITYGILIIRGAVDMPVGDFITRSVRIGLIVSVALAGGLYQTDIAEAITTTPDQLAQALLSDPSTGTSAASLIDDAAGRGFQKAGEAFDKAGFFSQQGVVFGLFGLLIVIATGILTAIGAAYLILAKIALALLAGLGPIFILALLFQPTARFFELWTAQILNYGLLVVLFASVFGLLMTMYGNYVGDMRFDGLQNVAYGLGGMVILSVGSIVILLQLPTLASSLAGGVGLGYMWELRAIRSGIGSRSLRNTDGSVRQRGSGAIGTSESAVRGAVSMASGGVAAAKKVAGHFKGSKAA